MNNADDSQSKKDSWPKWPLDLILFFAMVVAGLASVAYVWKFGSFSLNSNLERWGQTGDFFGGLLNPAISFATLVVAYAVWRQQKDELRETKEALERQAETAARQRKEQRFFDLLNVYYRSVDALQFNPQLNENSQGKISIQKWLSYSTALNGKTFWQFTELKGEWPGKMGCKNNATHPFYSVKWKREHGYMHFGSYLRTIESVLRVAESVFSSEDTSYITLFKDQLSDSELVLIGYFLWLDEERSRSLLEQVKRYGLLSHLMEGDLRAALEASLPKEVFTSNVAAADSAN